MDARTALAATAFGPLQDVFRAAEVYTVSGGSAFVAQLRRHDARHYGTVLVDSYLADGAAVDQPLRGPAERFPESRMRIWLQRIRVGGIGHCAAGLENSERRLAAALTRGS